MEITLLDYYKKCLFRMTLLDAIQVLMVSLVRYIRLMHAVEL